MKLVEYTDMCTGEKVIIDEDERLTIDNVVEKLKKRIDDITKDIPQGEKYPVNRDILFTFSFYMDFAVYKTNLDIAKQLHEIITSYFLGCYSNPWG